jgi:hypothetical protein
MGPGSSRRALSSRLFPGSGGGSDGRGPRGSRSAAAASPGRGADHDEGLRGPQGVADGEGDDGEGDAGREDEGEGDFDGLGEDEDDFDGLGDDGDGWTGGGTWAEARLTVGDGLATARVAAVAGAVGVAAVAAGLPEEIRTSG